MFPKLISKLLTKLEKMSTPLKLSLIAIMSLIALWLVCKKMSSASAASVRPVPSAVALQPSAYLSGAGMQNPGYGSGSGSVGMENFEAEAQCLGMDEFGKHYDSFPFYKMACHPEPQWNLPLDARIRHQPINGAPAETMLPACHHRHPMDSIYAPPNEGISL